MINVRKSEDRGHVHHGWLEAQHTFSFGSYRDPRFMGFSDLLVINEDRVAPGKGFGEHGHRDMEIVTYILDGALEHKDSTGSNSVLRPGDIQRMSAGRGVRHSEFNHSAEKPLHLLQIWILPREQGLSPEYEEKHFNPADRTNVLKLIVSPGGKDGSLNIHQDAFIYAALLDDGNSIAHRLGAGRHAWLQVARGELDLNGIRLEAGDGAAISDESELRATAKTSAEFLLFDLR